MSMPWVALQTRRSPTSEQPRLLAVSSNEEVLLLFTSGRVEHLRGQQTSRRWNVAAPGTGKQAALPDEPHAGEMLACITPLSHLPLSEFFLQVSRRGCVKKTMTSLAQSILGNHYLGRSTLQKSDQPFDVTLCQKKDIFAFVTFEGHLLGLDVDDLSYSAEERIRLTATDYVIASFVPHPDESLLFVTQTGKVIQRDRREPRTFEIRAGKGTGADLAVAAGAGSPLYRRGLGPG